MTLAIVPEIGRDMLLYSVEMRLKVVEGGTPRPTGYHLLSFFLGLLDRADPELAATLHGEGGPRPFTLSPLAPLGAGRSRAQVTEGSPWTLRLTFLQEEVLARFVDALWRLPSDISLPLGGWRVTCDSLTTTRDQNPAAFTSFRELLEGAGEERKLRLAFLSPTTFRSKEKRNVLFPEPSLVFGSLLARWNAYAPSSLRLSLDQAAEGVRVSGYRLSTHMLDFGSYQELGFQGQASYECRPDPTDDQVKALSALADFAFYSGVGAKTTMGMGQCRRIESAGSLSHRERGHVEERGRPSGSS